nr:tetratricopeptide repeat protein [Candidatus Brocadiales bacterium]
MFSDPFVLLYEKSSGHPLRFALALKYLWGDLDSNEWHAYTSDEIDKLLVSEMRKLGAEEHLVRGSFEREAHYILPYIAYLNQRFSTVLLAKIAERPDLIGSETFAQSDRDWESFLENMRQSYFFVKGRPDGYIQLHDEMERLINDYWWPTIDPVKNIRRDLAQIACQYYDDEISRLENDGVNCDDWKAEQLVYWFDFDPDKASGLLQKHGYASPMLNTLLTVEISPSDVRKLPQEYRYQLATDLGERAHRVYQYKRGGNYWEIALESAHDKNKRIEALLGLHNCLYHVDIDLALKILEEYVQSQSTTYVANISPVFHAIGLTYRIMFDIEHAIENYSKAKDIATANKDRPLTSKILNDMGYAYVFIGEYKKAGRLIRRALELRQAEVRELEANYGEVVKELNTTSKIHDTDLSSRSDALENSLQDAWWKLGLSFNTLGQIKRFDGDFSAAIGAYSRALEIFSRENVNNFLWQATALHSRGEAYRRTADTLFAQERISESDRYERLALEDFYACVALCDQYGFSVEKTTAYRRLGRLRHDIAMRTGDLTQRLDLLAEAQDYFEQGLKIAKDGANLLEELENATEIAFLVDDRLDAQKEISKNNLLTPEQKQRGRESIDLLRDTINRRVVSPHLLYDTFVHLLEMEEGAFYFALEQYDKSLEFYLDSFKGLARAPGYGTARYRQHLRHLDNQIRKLNKCCGLSEVRRWVDEFRKTWEETVISLPLHGQHPQTL